MVMMGFSGTFLRLRDTNIPIRHALRSPLSTIAYLLLSFSKVLADDTCSRWFASGQVQSGKSCESQCVTLMTNMSTFHCTSRCRKLCEDSRPKNLLGKLIYYPGLTPAEKKLVEDKPSAAFHAFVQKTRAEFSSSRHFPDQGIDDESDAFRHFIWAGFLTNELGPTMAKEFLDAHEANVFQLEPQREMDKFNNQMGISTALLLKSSNRWSTQNLEKHGLDLLRSKKLQVLKPGLKIPEVPQ